MARLAAFLQRERSWEVAVVTARIRPGQAQYSVERGVVDGVPVFGIVQNYPYRGLPEAVDDPALDRVFSGIVKSFAPDLISIQTLSGLSVGFIDAARAAGVPVAVHLHDGWWACPSGGQRLHPDGSLCLPVDRSRCGRCFDSYCHREGPLERGARALARRLPNTLSPDTLHRAFQVLPDGGQEFLRRVNERGARLRERHSVTAPTSDAHGQVDAAIVARSRRIAEAFASIDLVISPTRFLAESLKDDGLQLPGLRIEPTGVPLPDPTSQTPLPAEGPLQVLFLGTWVPHKGPQVLARALAALPKQLFDDDLIRAKAVGPAPFPAFQQEVLAESQGRLNSQAAVAPSEVPRLLAAADVVVVPSVWAENAPLVALEARAEGRPVIASDIGGLPELIEDGSDGLLFPAGDEQALASILAELASNRDTARALAASVRPPRGLEDFACAVQSAYLELCDQRPVQETGT
jgi:glycosyltransferase involved in cell wall biosynthesis